VVLNNSTISANSVGFSGAVTASNTIFAGNTQGGASSDCGGTLTSGGYNLIQSTSGFCIITGTTTGNILNQNARLGLLGDNGGPTQTHALALGSPAIDTGNPIATGSGGRACTISDQRGVARPLSAGGRCDIGVVESQGGGLSITRVTPGSAGNTGPL